MSTPHPRIPKIPRIAVCMTRIGRPLRQVKRLAKKRGAEAPRIQGNESRKEFGGLFPITSFRFGVGPSGQPALHGGLDSAVLQNTDVFIFPPNGESVSKCRSAC
jgi:hypothetical protein